MATQASSRVPSAAANGKHGHSLISDAKFRQLYELTLRLRLEVRRANGHGHPLTGREAALAAVTADLRSGDALIAGQPLPAGMHPAEASGSFADSVIAAMGRAAADRLKKNQRVTVIFAGSATDPLLSDAQSLAGVARLPVLFVEDAAPQKSGPAKSGPAKSASRRAPAPAASSLISIPVDAQDVIALYRVAHESISRAREGSCPTRILLTAWPARKGQADDAVAHLERWLQARGLPAQQWRREILGEAPGSAPTVSPEVL